MLEKLKKLIELSHGYQFRMACIIVDEDNYEYTGISLQNPCFRDMVSSEISALNDWLLYSRSPMKKMYLLIDKEMSYYDCLRIESLLEHGDIKLELYDKDFNKKDLMLSELRRNYV